MAKQGAKAAVPRLRFPEFRQAAAWKETTLVSASARIAQGGTPDTSVPSYWDGDVAWITPAEMGKGEDPHVASTVRRITEEGLQSCSSDLLPVRSVIISTRAPIGHLAINVVPMAINQGCKGIVPGPDLDHRFLFASLLLAKRRLTDLGAGNTFKELSTSALKNFAIALPTRPEQQKIADCLTSLDEVIAAQGRKVEALKAHKRGLMQQLFPREGETRPRLRFPEFRGAPEWEAKRLEDVAPLQRGFDLTSSQIEAGDVPVVYSNGVRSYHNVGMASGPGLVTGRSGTIGSLHFIDNGNYWPHNTSLWVTTFKGHDPKFVYYLYAAIGIERFASGSGVPTLNRNDVHAFETRVPEAKREQQRIADCLSSLDTQITAESNQLAALKTHKQGLMQQLFPAPEAD